MITEKAIVQEAQRALGRAFVMESSVMTEYLASVGLILQPFDVDVVLLRHPGLFQSDHRGRWMLA